MPKDTHTSKRRRGAVYIAAAIVTDLAVSTSIAVVVLAGILARVY